MEKAMGIDIGERQIQGEEQKTVLEALASMAARQGCLFIEVGSWCGGTSVILARIAREHGGHLECVDWWKGSPGTELSEIARKNDVFSFFWGRIKDEGLEDTVIPLRGHSRLVAGLLKEGAFDLAFIDADHTHAAVSSDILNYAPLVRSGGILCGHDCEGRIADYDLDFLLSGKDKNFQESVHCGVVLAVGEAFKDYSINCNIWSVRAREAAGWEAARPAVGVLKDKRQLAPIPFGLTRSRIVARYGSLIYAAPRSLVDFDASQEANCSHPEVVKAPTLAGIEAAIGEKVEFSDAAPVCYGSYRDFNLIRFSGRCWAMSRTLGNVDLVALDEEAAGGLEKNGLCAAGRDWAEVKRLVDGLMHLYPEMREEGYMGFNIVAYRKRFYAILQDLGAFDIKTVNDEAFAGLMRSRRCAVAATHEEARRLVDELASGRMKSEPQNALPEPNAPEGFDAAEKIRRQMDNP